MKKKQAVVIIKLLRVPTAATMVAFSTVSGVFVSRLVLFPRYLVEDGLYINLGRRFS